MNATTPAPKALQSIQYGRDRSLVIVGASGQRGPPPTPRRRVRALLQRGASAPSSRAAAADSASLRARGPHHGNPLFSGGSITTTAPGSRPVVFRGPITTGL